MAFARLALTVLDCDDPASLAAFWVALLNGEIAHSTDDVVLVKAEGGSLAMTRVADYQPPTWPDGPRPKQIHLDLAVDDLDAAEAEAIRLGARRADTQPGPHRWRVLLDPAGHPFCLCDWSQPA
ncbi:VOC family protein [Actinomadura syzygii]|uniref:VOC family protein n=1 Tax=Actinomadura syzygii TaxID=1427538 RepID=A0A5D0UJI5_9ACTN|nr:VOC family protein [Actinomadura syzygii]TYC18254.1 VOC family protein [Actinomadura syzygii]